MAHTSKFPTFPGPKARRILARDAEVISPSYTRGYPFVMARGKGAEVWDVDGNRFIDFTTGIAVTSTGHSHPAVVKAIQEQAEKFIHMSGTDFYYEVQVELAEKLNAIAPFGGEPAQFFFRQQRRRGCRSGAQAGPLCDRPPTAHCLFGGLPRAHIRRAGRYRQQSGAA